MTEIRLSNGATSYSQTVSLKPVYKSLQYTFKEKCESRKTVDVNEFMSGNNYIN